MTHILKPRFHHPAMPKNGLGLTRRDYEGVISTLCAGCGHDSVTGAIIEACFELDVEAHRIAKLSGILYAGAGRHGAAVTPWCRTTATSW